MKNESQDGRIGYGGVDRSAARNALLVNVLVLPGMGSLMRGRIVAGLGQLVMGIAGFALVMLWFFGMMIRYYGLMFGDENPGFSVPGWIGGAGLVLFAIAWLWALVTGIALVREAARNALRKSMEQGTQ